MARRQWRRSARAQLAAIAALVRGTRGATHARMHHRILLALAVAACGADTAEPPTGGTPQAVTYHQDVKPILDAKCAGCHVAGGIGPFELTDYASAAEYAQAAAGAVASRAMPPWAPDSSCRDYTADRSLTAAQIATIQQWVTDGTAEGDAATPGAPLADSVPSLSRVVAALAMAESYTPAPPPGASDDYRCFVVPWPAEYTSTTYVTGFRARPGNALVVHHVIAFLAPPATVAEAQALDATEAGPGYTCFGGAGVRTQGMVGGWTPGSLGSDLPPGIGLPVEAGSAIILQIHYNTDHAATKGETALADLSSVELKIDPSVARPGRIFPFLNPVWPQGSNMLIPANQPDVVHAFSADPTRLTGELEVFSAALHMHTLGTQGTLRIDHPDSTSTCLLDIPAWDFHWQGSYGFAQSQVLRRGDKVSIECRFDNTAAHQPLVDGHPRAPADVTWGEGTGDEMCIGFFLTAAL
jgi:hypothetical protein